MSQEFATPLVRTMLQVTAAALALLGAASPLAAAPPALQTATVVIRPAASIGSGCPMLAEDTGTPTTHYSTAAMENNVFTFADPLPPHSVLSHVSVQVSMLATCLPSNGLVIALNRTLPGVGLADAQVGTVYPAQQIHSCSAPAQFGVFGAPYLWMIGPPKIPYVRNGTNVIHVDESAGPGCGDVRIEKIIVTLHYYADVPSIDFDLTATSNPENRKVLMRLHRADYDYLSPYQRLAQRPQQTEDQILVRGYVRNPDGTPYPNETIYVRTLDPPDAPVPYLPATPPRWADNPYGWAGLNLPKDQTFLWSSITTDAAGNFEVIMPARGLSGDNLALTASALFLPIPWAIQDDRCTADRGCYATGPITAWRRVYVEADRMFRYGVFLRADVAAGATEIPVEFDRDFDDLFDGVSATNPIPIVLIHSPLNSPAVQTTWTSEARNVVGRKGRRNERVLVLDQPVIHSYFARSFPIGQRDYPAGDAVGVHRGDSDLFPTYAVPAIGVFGGTFTQHVILPPAANTLTFFPHVKECPAPTRRDQTPYCSAIASLWFENRLNRNHHHLVAAASHSSPGFLGVTDLHGYAVAFIFNSSIDRQIRTNNSRISGLDPVAVTIEVTAHELVHLFDVNQPAATSDGHCEEHAWSGGLCLMNPDRLRAERADGIMDLHVSPWDTSEYRRIRRQPEPLPRVFQTTFDPNP